ncbi:MAG: hypothetical protein M1839_009040 [Geoglossum umbratile]|nr:MAG: hypothetical protein M1839_009040 [Geoglossum umbratile]
MWYSNGALSWGHEYDSPLMADPQLSSEDLWNENEAGKQLAIDSAPKALDLGTRALQAHDPFWILPYELTSEILLHLSSTDILNLRLSSRKITLTKLPMEFWKSRFWPRNELGFAKSLCRPETCTWENWYVFVREQCKSGPKHKNLMNRKRIWHLAGYLVELVSTVKSRIALGSATLDLSLGRSRRVTCVPPTKFSGPGCRELTHRAVSFDSSLMFQLRGLEVTSVAIGDRRFISGVRFVFDNGNPTCLGYVDDKKDSWMGCNGKSQTDLSMQMLFSSEGFEAITLEARPLRQGAGLPMTDDYVFAQIPLRHLRGLMVGLDGMRIVSISASFAIEHSLDFMSLCWGKGLPSAIPFITDSDMAALQLCQQHFAPASHVMFGKPGLLIITIFTKGPSVGITGMHFDYANGESKIWGTCKGVTLSFFLNGIGESITIVETCQVGSVVNKLKLTTNLQRTCIFSGKSPGFPEPNLEGVSLKYTATHRGNIVGFCGCFVGPNKSLACLGFFTDTGIFCGPSSLDPTLEDTSFTNSGGGYTHYDSVQASVASAGAEYREHGQVTGLLFRPSGSDYPELIGQWIEPGEKYNLAANENILDLNFTTCHGPNTAPRNRTSLSQVKDLAIITSLGRTLLWGQKDRNIDIAEKPKLIFNSVFDHISLNASVEEVTERCNMLSWHEENRATRAARPEILARLIRKRGAIPGGALASPSLPALPAETLSGDSPEDRLQIARQESAARIVNMIVNGLWNDWAEKAFLMYRAFAKLNYKSHIIQSLGVDCLSIIAQNAVEKLKEVEVPSFSSKEDLFDPSWMLCQFLNSDNLWNERRSARTKVWTEFLNRSGPNCLSQKNLESLVESDLNGGQIKNAVRTAHALAINEGKKMSYEHFETVLHAIDDFDHDFKGSGQIENLSLYT